jgi:hypothetical protein
MPNDSKRMTNSRNRVDDEFFTLYADIAAELPHYKAQLKGKRILCPCDWDESLDEVLVYASEDTVASSHLFAKECTVKHVDADRSKRRIERSIDLIKCNFVKFLIAHAEDYRIASIAVSGYRPATGHGVRFQDIDYSKYDIVITNPPFSQFREFIKTLFDKHLQFIVIGPQNAITYRDCFERIRNNEMWLGYHHHLQGFKRPDGTIIPKNDNLPRCCCWFTNLDVSYRHDRMILTAEYDPDKNPTYVNYDAIEVSKTASIPCDYPGKMGVPITFLQKYNPEQFEIIGSSRNLGTDMRDIAERGSFVQGGVRFYLPQGDGTFRCLFDRIVIRNKEVTKDE